MKTHRLPLVLISMLALGGSLALHVAAAPANDANRLEARFTESAVSITNRIADLGTSS